MIRRAEQLSDFAVCADIYAEVEHEKRVTAEQMAQSKGVTLLAADLGFAYVTRSSVTDAAFAMVRVRPTARQHGIGSALLGAVAANALELGRHELWGRVYEHDGESRRFLAGRGFDEVTRDIEVVLRVAPGDGAWSPGIVELAPEHLEGAYAVVAEAVPEMALPQVAAAEPFEEWFAEEERFGVFAVVALDGDVVVGYARLYRMPGQDHRLENGLTAVKQSHRRRGLATAMKRAQIAWAAEHGYTEIVSDMVEGNAAMRGVNERLGYRELPAQIVVNGWPA